jgi:hypothetical protein
MPREPMIFPRRWMSTCCTSRRGRSSGAVQPVRTKFFSRQKGDNALLALGAAGDMLSSSPSNVTSTHIVRPPRASILYPCTVSTTSHSTALESPAACLACRRKPWHLCASPGDIPARPSRRCEKTRQVYQRMSSSSQTRG